MSTFVEIVDEVKAKLSGYTMRQEKITYLNDTSGITKTASSIKIGSGDNFAKGIIEVEDELILIDAFDIATSTLTIMPGFGRGWQGTTAAAHNRYSQVTITPTYPRTMVKKAINNTIKSVFPKLFAVRNTSFKYNASVATYALPDDCYKVISVSWRVPGSAKYWSPVRHYRVDSTASQTEFGTTNTITIGRSIMPGAEIQITYSAMPDVLSSNTDNFNSITGLPDSSIEVITLGASARLLAFIDAGRLNFVSAEADAADTKIPSYAGQSISKYVTALYQQRLAEESSRLLEQYPTAPHYIN